MNAPNPHLDPDEVVPDFDDVMLLKFSRACMAEIQKRAASSRYGDFIRLKTAAHIVGKSRETVRRWVHEDPLLGKSTPSGLVVSASQLTERCQHRKR